MPAEQANPFTIDDDLLKHPEQHMRARAFLPVNERIAKKHAKRLSVMMNLGEIVGYDEHLCPPTDITLAATGTEDIKPNENIL